MAGNSRMKRAARRWFFMLLGRIATNSFARHGGVERLPQLLIAGDQLRNQPLQPGVLGFQLRFPRLRLKFKRIHLYLLFFRLEAAPGKTPTHSPAEFFPLFGSHLFPAFRHAAAPVLAAASATAMEAAKQDLAQQQQADCLPERDRVPSEDIGDQRIPQALHQKTEYCYRSGNNCDDL
jgi:hypothetical protein